MRITADHLYAMTRAIPVEWNWVRAWMTPERAQWILGRDWTWRELGEFAHWCWGAPTDSQHLGDILLSEAVRIIT